MTLEEAIQHCKEVSESIECNESKAEHEQLTVWLEALNEIVGAAYNTCSSESLAEAVRDTLAQADLI